MNLLTNKIITEPAGFNQWLNKIPEEGGLILINKDEGWTSFDIVRKLKYILKIKKIGHAGTLDPLASGLVIVAVGKGTKLLNSIQNDDKQYIGHIKLGVTTPSYDRETEEEEATDISGLTAEQIIENRQNFIGDLTNFHRFILQLSSMEKELMNLQEKKLTYLSNHEK